MGPGPRAKAGLGLAAADVNGDGLNDLIVTDQAGEFVEVVYNQSVTAAAPNFATVVDADAPATNFVNVQLGQINGRAFDDVSRDGASRLSKPARAGITVYVDLNGNGQPDPGEPSLVTGPDGYYAFSGLPAGHYQVRYVDDETRRPTTADGGVYQTDLSVPGHTLTGLDFGNAVSIDRLLTVPAGTGTTDWTVAVNNGRLEVFDSMMGVIDSEPLADLRSLTVVNAVGGPTRLTLDLAGGFFSLPGGVTFVGSAGDRNTLRLVLGPGDDNATVQGPQATLDAGLDVRWARVSSLEIDGGPGNDRVIVGGTPLAQGTIDLIGGPGDDTYFLATRNSAVRITDGGGTDTLDFSASAAGVSVNLGLDRGQVQHIGGGNNTLAITGTIEDLTGTPYADVLTGNGANDVIRGLAGNDVLTAGRGNTVLVGGPGNDVLIAGPGRDVLIGGTGSDVLLGYWAPAGGRPSAGSILVGGSTAYDANDQALRAILAEWASARPLAQRVANLTNGGGSKYRLNGGYFLNARTVQPGAADVLFGDSRADWFLAFRGDWVIDQWRRGRDF